MNASESDPTETAPVQLPAVADIHRSYPRLWFMDGDEWHAETPIETTGFDISA